LITKYCISLVTSIWWCYQWNVDIT